MERGEVGWPFWADLGARTALIKREFAPGSAQKGSSQSRIRLNIGVEMWSAEGHRLLPSSTFMGRLRSISRACRSDSASLPLAWTQRLLSPG